MSVRVKLNSAGVRAILKSAEVQAELLRRATAMADAAGEGHEITPAVGKTRARVSVKTATYAARKRQAVRRNLSSALDSGR